MPFSEVVYDAVGHLRPRRWLCVCERGNCRSVHLAGILKEDLHQDAIALGITAAALYTQVLLGEWADHIVLCDQELMDLVPEPWKAKLLLFDVGEDRFFQGWNPTLITLFRNHLNEHANPGQGPAANPAAGTS